MIQSALLATTVFFFIFGWKITPLADLILLTSLLLVAYSFIRGYIYADKLCLQVTIALGALAAYSLTIVLANGLFDVQVAMRSLRALINFLGALSLAGLYFAIFKNGFFYRLARDIYLAIAAHALLMMAMYLSGGFREMIYHFTEAYEYVNLASPFLDGLRICGLTYGLSQTSVLQMLGLVLLPLAIKDCQSKSGALILLAGIPLLVFSILISGRSGLMLGLFFLLLYFGSLFFPYQPGFSFCGAIKKTGVYLCGIFFVIMVLYASVNILPEKFSRYSLEQAQEILPALQLAGPTVDNMSGMFFLPESWLETFFGSSNLNHGDLETIQSDVGWVKNIFAVGLFGSILTLIPYLLGLKAAWHSRIDNFEIAFLSFLIFLSALILHGKEMALLTRNQWSVQALILAALCLQLNKSVLLGSAQCKGEREGSSTR